MKVAGGYLQESVNIDKVVRSAQTLATAVLDFEGEIYSHSAEETGEHIRISMSYKLLVRINVMVQRDCQRRDVKWWVENIKEQPVVGE